MVNVSVSKKKNVKDLNSTILEVNLMDYNLSKKVYSNSGKIIINYDSKTCEVELKGKMSSEERLAVLKKIFDEFYMLYSIKELNGKKLKLEIDQFTFRDKLNDEDYENPKSLIENLMFYDIKSFNEDSKAERIIISVITLCDDIHKKLKKHINKIGLPILADRMTESEEKFCYEIIMRYFENLGYDGKLVSRIVF